MTDPILFGADYSVYVRIVRLVLEELGIPHERVAIDIFAEDLPDEYFLLHPFGKIPALQHGDFALYETDAIASYLIDAFEGAALLGVDAQSKARGRQIMRVMDNYGYPILVWAVFVPELDAEEPTPADEETCEEARVVLQALNSLMTGPFMLGEEISLADLWALPMLTYFNIAPTGRALLEEFPRLRDWLAAISQRPSVQATRSPRETQTEA